MTNQASHQGLLRFITAGSVDDGKSTLIGRLLYDSKAVLTDQLQALANAKNKRTAGEQIDFSLLTDGLEAEREQGITIDVAYRYFSTARRKFIIADTPGHEQYTRNMVTGASTAHAAIILIDATRVATVDGKTEVTEIPLKKNTMIFIGILGANLSKEVWGEDAEEWKPERWLTSLPGSVADAKMPGVYSNLCVLSYSCSRSPPGRLKCRRSRMTFWAGSRSCMSVYLFLLHRIIVPDAYLSSSGFKFSQLEMSTWPPLS